jgi:glycerophosphoryl diester phosphodiesterase
MTLPVLPESHWLHNNGELVRWDHQGAPRRSIIMPWRNFPGNSDAAFEAGHEDGTVFKETDCRYTAGREWVAHHNPELPPTVLNGRLIADLNVAERRALSRDGYPVTPVAELVEKYPGHWSFDFKKNEDLPADADDPGVPMGLGIVRELGIEEESVLGSFSGRSTMQLRAGAPNAIFTLTGDEVARLAIHIADRSFDPDDPEPIGGHIASVPPYFTDLEGKRTRVTTPEFYEECQRRNVKVHVWTLNKGSELRENLGVVDGYYTDRRRWGDRVTHRHTQGILKRVGLMHPNLKTT